MCPQGPLHLDEVYASQLVNSFVPVPAHVVSGKSVRADTLLDVGAAVLITMLRGVCECIRFVQSYARTSANGQSGA